MSPLTRNEEVKFVLPLRLKYCRSIDNINYLALLEHPLLRSLSTQFLDVLEHVEDDVLNVYCNDTQITPELMIFTQTCM